MVETAIGRQTTRASDTMGKVCLCVCVRGTSLRSFGWLQSLLSAIESLMLGLGITHPAHFTLEAIAHELSTWISHRKACHSGVKAVMQPENQVPGLHPRCHFSRRNRKCGRQGAWAALSLSCRIGKGACCHADPKVVQAKTSSNVLAPCLGCSAPP